jgi:hypothetical protein
MGDMVVRFGQHGIDRQGKIFVTVANLKMVLDDFSLMALYFIK